MNGGKPTAKGNKEIDLLFTNYRLVPYFKFLSIRSMEINGVFFKKLEIGYLFSYIFQEVKTKMKYVFATFFFKRSWVYSF